MTTTTLIVGAAFGDEGKGRAVDWSIDMSGNEEEDDFLVVRYSGGANAGHTVVLDDVRHVHHHFGSGSLRKAHTLLGDDFIANPLLFFKELRQLEKLGFSPVVFSMSRSPITTWMDMIVNEMIEIERGAAAHGSVGLGIHETRVRSVGPHRLSFGNLKHSSSSYVDSALRQMRDDYFPERMEALGIDPRRHPERMELFNSPQMFERWSAEARRYAERINTFDLTSHYEDIIFEGSQGLLLDQDSRYFPHVTHSRVGASGMIELAKSMGIESLDYVHYCMRSYVTRHGAGPLPGERKDLSYEDDTNVPHQWQGTMRFAPHTDESLDQIFGAIEKDAAALDGAGMLDGCDVSLVISHVDQTHGNANVFRESDLMAKIVERSSRVHGLREHKYVWVGTGKTASDVAFLEFPDS